MTWGFAIAGALLGIMFAAGAVELFGLVAGGLLGLALGRIIQLGRRIDTLEVERGRAPSPVSAPTPVAAPRKWEPASARPVPLPTMPSRAVAAAAADHPKGSAGGSIDVALRFARQWLTTGNVPVKVGVIVSFFGVAFLLKYAIDRQLFRFPIEWRLLTTAAVAMALMVIGWRLRTRLRVYALSLQGGGFGILYLTTFAAFRLYELIPSVFAFALLVVLTIAGGALAVLQNARGLATLGAAGGFLAPVLVSTGAGNHVVLFSYYLVLNSLILGVAWYRPWRELNLIGFAFTFVIGGMWAWQRYEPGMYASTQPFVVLFFLFYQAVAILFARRQAPAMRGLVDGTLVFATPVLVFAMQAVMLRHTEFGLAYSALVAALFYAATATWLNRDRVATWRLLIEAYLALAVSFATLAIPLALDARWTSAAWALEGAALVWIGQRQDRLLARVAGVLLVVGAGVAFMQHGWQAFEGPPVLNGNLLGGMLIALAALIAARLLERVTGRWAGEEWWAGRLLLAFGVAWWIGTGAREITERMPVGYDMTGLIAFFPVSALLLTVVAQRLAWPAAGAANFVALPLLALMLPTCTFASGHPLARAGWVAWPVAFAIQYGLLRRHAAGFPQLTQVAHLVTAVLLALLVVVEVYWQTGQQTFGDVWPGAAASFVPGLFLIVMLRMRARGAWPVAAFEQAYARGAGISFLALQWLIVVFLNAAGNGDPAPLPYLPLVNPVDLASAFALLGTWHWLRETGAASGRVKAWLGVVAFVVSTVALLRAMHHLGGVPWRLAAMQGSVLLQAAISVYWGVLAFTGMVIGARRAHRGFWMAGALLMGVVVAKLFLVELGNTGTVARIVSFIAIGGLLLVVGYLAPAPPRQASTTDA